MNKTIGAAVAAVFALAACASAGDPRMMKACEAPKDTMITVQDDAYVVVNQDPIYVCKANVKVTWYLDPAQTSKYEFHDDSIVIKDPGNNDEFSNCKGSGNGGEVGSGKDTIKCHDKKDKSSPPKRVYKYDIKIYSRGSAPNAQPVATYDPNVVND